MSHAVLTQKEEECDAMMKKNRLNKNEKGKKKAMCRMKAGRVRKGK
jgi:hypothetical protein